MAFYNNSGVASSRGGTQLTTIDNISWYSKNSMANLSGPLTHDLSYVGVKDTPRSPAGLNAFFVRWIQYKAAKNILHVIFSFNNWIFISQQPTNLQKDFRVV